MFLWIRLFARLAMGFNLVEVCSRQRKILSKLLILNVAP